MAFITAKLDEKWRIIWDAQHKKYFKAKGAKKKKLEILRENIHLTEQQCKEYGYDLE